MATGPFAVVAAVELVPVDCAGMALYSPAYSHYTRRMVQARPELAEIVAQARDQPLTRAWMAARLKVLHEPSADVDDAIKRALRRLRARSESVV